MDLDWRGSFTNSMIHVLLKRTYCCLPSAPVFSSLSFYPYSARGIEPNHHQYNVLRRYVFSFPPQYLPDRSFTCSRYGIKYAICLRSASPHF
jgi:hypothetical protein